MLSQIGTVKDFQDEADVEWTKKHCLLSLTEHVLKQYQRLHRWRHSFSNGENVVMDKSGGWINSKPTYTKISIVPARFLVR